MELKAEKIAKWYHRKTGDANRFFAMQETNLTISSGTLTVLTGRSGSGKTTLLHILGGLLRPDQGNIHLGEIDLYSMEDRELSKFRNRHFGMIPQGYTAVRSLTVLENILLPAGMYKPEKDGSLKSNAGANIIDKAGSIEDEADRLLERFEN